MKYPCEVIRDLMPLYCDGVCSQESKNAVAEHTAECAGCRDMLTAMQQPSGMEEVSREYGQKQMDSMKSVKKKVNHDKRVIGIICLVVGLIIAMVAFWCLLAIGTFSILVTGMRKAVYEEITEIEEYNDAIGEDAIKKYNGKWGMDESIFPAKITDDMNVTEFDFVYINKWDAQYIAYLTVEYTDEDYAAEVERLSGCTQDDWGGYYSVTGAPEFYRVLALDSDDYNGFVYAITPEKETTRVTYVMIVFCNYFIEPDIEDFLPDKYIPQGFDASEDNPYRQYMLDHPENRMK